MEKTYNDILKLLEDLNIFDDKIIKLFKVQLFSLFEKFKPFCAELTVFFCPDGDCMFENVSFLGGVISRDVSS